MLVPVIEVLRWDGVTEPAVWLRQLVSSVVRRPAFTLGGCCLRPILTHSTDSECVAPLNSKIIAELRCCCEKICLLRLQIHVLLTGFEEEDEDCTSPGLHDPFVKMSSDQQV